MELKAIAAWTLLLYAGTGQDKQRPHKASNASPSAVFCHFTRVV